MTKANKKAMAEVFECTDYQPLFDAFGITLGDELLKLALTHRSFAHEVGGIPHNERLEFLGDSVLGLSIAHRLYERYPDYPESTISKMRATVVSRYGLAEVAREIGLGRFILLGKGETLTDGADKDSILADTTEAILGAIYLEHGFEAARQVILNLFEEKISIARTDKTKQDWKTNLQERLAALKLPMAEYRHDMDGPEHEPTFTIYVSVGGVEMAQGSGRNKKAGEQEAAHNFLQALDDPHSFQKIAHLRA